MENEITYREYNEDDFQDLVSIIKTTWEYESKLSKRPAQILASIDLLRVLSRATFTRVAIKDNRIVGFLIGKSEKGKAPSRGEEINKAFDDLKTCRFGKTINLIRIILDSQYLKLYEKSNAFYSPEILFFAILEDCRGNGIGKRLYEDFILYLKNDGATKVVVNTDSLCNYGFYEHYGFKVKAKKTFGFPLSKKLSITFYIYENKI